MTTSNGSLPSLRALWREVFDEEGVKAEEAEELGGFRLGFTGEAGQLLCFVHYDEARGHGTVFALAPFVVAPDRRDEVARFITRANFGLPFGCFELDYDDGELRFRATAVFGAGPRTTAPLRSVLWASVAALDRYLPGLVATAQQGLSPDEALALCGSKRG